MCGPGRARIAETAQRRRMVFISHCRNRYDSAAGPMRWRTADDRLESAPHGRYLGTEPVLTARKQTHFLCHAFSLPTAN